MKFKLLHELPPILPDIQAQLKEYLICPERLPIHQYERNQEFWPRETDLSALFRCDVTSCGTTLKVQRDPNTGKIIEFREVPIAEAGTNAKNSMSLNRAPAPPTEGVRGDPTNYPFWPGGFPDPIIDIPETQSADFSELLTVPPGFKRGLEFEADGCTVVTDTPSEISSKPSKIEIDETDNTVNLMALVQQEQDFLGLWSESKTEVAIGTLKQADQPVLEINEAEILPTEPEIPVLNISNVKPIKINNTVWAEMVDITQPMKNFNERIPEMAHEYPFKLDTFQKQAILKLEENRDVFVAAHTSAGKTVVAEYAIALSQKHKTRTIYTSPIKALSNQKYRDFKKTFEDVGLITGDFQINQTAVCLIMTTEILRSMLYCGSEVIRDLEYVIFDEVHYINDAERGHVWEEVLILLPNHVRIVLLSATVPNTMEFANWLGMTKKRKVYVITTLYRPVPLQHYLYTGTGGSSKDDRFLLIDANGDFLLQGYNSMTGALNKHKKDPNKYVSFELKMKQEATAIAGLINHLQRNDLLPVVAFTFSRVMCDKVTDNLNYLDLTTAREKSKIHSFYQECIKRLKEPDREIPQIKKMEDILKRGLGVHHSGILPIVKEIVEMLFHDGLVKVLLATETFAMGVNMPARTVVFNAIQKFDGKDVRNLRPEEYIQMAGRAGRRGLDKTGTVIIRCSEVYPMSVLKEMMQGKPQKLVSQFRLTYSMLLSLLRVESLSIESMMSHSFHEVQHVTKADQLKVDLERTQAELSEVCAKELGDHKQQLIQYYKAASEYIKEWKYVQPKILLQSRAVKELTPGRVLLISHKNHYKKLGILLNAKKDNLIYKVLVLSDQKRESDEIQLTLKDTQPDNTAKKEAEHPEDWYRMISYTQDIFQPDGVGGHEVLEIPLIDIIEIVDKTIKLDWDLVLKDWEKRQIPRFRNDSPGQTCQQAIQKLSTLTNNVLSGTQIKYLDPVKDFHITDMDLCMLMYSLLAKQVVLNNQLPCTKVANFEEQFYMVFKRKFLEEKLEHLKYMISTRSLSLYPEYESRVQVLKELRYINEENRVELKGRVACGMGMNELLITELIFRNTLSNLQPAEVAALLSPLIFQTKVKQEPKLIKTLEEGFKKIKDIHLELKNIENKYCITGEQEELNPGLIEVVYEWAREKPFAEIMELTDVQEGIIVRCIQQLNEILKDVRNAAMLIGDPVLQTKMDEASNAIKRDIVFAVSLYTRKEAINL